VQKRERGCGLLDLGQFPGTSESILRFMHIGVHSLFLFTSLLLQLG